MLETEDRTALQLLAREELPGLYALARRLAGADAEDLVQEALLRACRSYGSLRDRQAATKWLRVILTNVWRDRLRKGYRDPGEVLVDEEEGFSLYRTLIEEDPAPYSDTLHIDFLGAFSEEDVHLVLQRLPAKYRGPLVLRYVEGFATAEIAEMLELPLGTVLSQLHRGRHRFEREMWSYAEESGLLSELTAAGSGTASAPASGSGPPRGPEGTNAAGGARGVGP
ncbi:sigma-70 family RNA polymerase sigma factor [Egibacter rhizosphaerae]|uniref:sigma-70 family RNA polymerase sigma factor n=1 Tax=Egibacter rhizosphaerae TaxID=1670831 RepID=UPI00197AB0BA|nr:sigma-70 family RNA polymerase sigma factor [Egibacter rhizosphaerae]